MLGSVIRGEWLVISGPGSGSHVDVSRNVTLGESVLIIRVSESDLSHVSSRRLVSFSVREGTCPVELRSSSRLRMKFEMTGWRKRDTVFPRILSL